MEEMIQITKKEYEAIKRKNKMFDCLLDVLENQEEFLKRPMFANSNQPLMEPLQSYITSFDKNIPNWNFPIPSSAIKYSAYQEELQIIAQLFKHSLVSNGLVKKEDINFDPNYLRR